MKNDELASFGIRAYQSGDFDTAVQFLSELIGREPQLWTCRLYLAMSYERAGRTSHARAELTTISQWSTDQSIRSKALEALRAINHVHTSTLTGISKVRSIGH